MRAMTMLLATLIAGAACARGNEEADIDTAALGSGGLTPGGDTAAARPADPVVAQPAPANPAASGAPGGSTGRPPQRTPGRPPPQTPSAPPSGAADTARGVVAVVVAVTITEVILRPPAGRPITLTGPLAREIGAASGAEVWVRGRRVDDRTMEVTSYAVRTVDGVRAITGRLVADGDRLVLVTDDGARHTIARPPASLRDHVGARVWISGDPGTTINAYGVLRHDR